MRENYYDTKNDEILVKMKQFFKDNFIYLCLAAACVSLLLYLIAFSCELSHLLDTRRMTTDPVSILLCVIYFILFFSATILINGLATRLSTGLLVWSFIVSLLSIPELWLIMVQFWGIESNHALSEVITYFVRLVINCGILLNIIPLALKWRKEKKVLSQLESLASRLQLTAVSPSSYNGNYSNSVGLSTKDFDSETSHKDSISEKVGGIDNPGFIQNYLHYGSQNEFDASIFGMNPSQYCGPPPSKTNAKRTQSLLDLRFVQSSTKIVQKAKDKSDSISLNSYDMRLQNNLAKTQKASKGSREQLYHTIEPPFNKSLGRNCVSLENLGLFITEDGFSGNFPGYPPAQQYPAYFYYNNPYQQPQHSSVCMGYHNNYMANQSSGYFNNSTSLGNSKQSIDDYRKYRDVAL